MLDAKLTTLTTHLSRLPGAIVAYSGGADSAFLAEMAHATLGDRSIAVTADSASIPRRELEQASALAVRRGWAHRVIGTDELSDDRYASNPTDRCYWCKSALFDRLMPMSESSGWSVLIGTNLDDLGDWRPGQVAASERGALHPLVDAGLTKAEIREASLALGLETADKAASACLSSRFAYGVRVTALALARVERAEDWLLSMGFEVVRVRDLGNDMAKVEVGPDQLDLIAEMRDLIEERLISEGFSTVEIDGKGYRQGALNEGVVLLAPPIGRVSLQ